MKKLVSLVLVLAMLCGLGISAAAVGMGDHSQDVKITVQNSSAAADTYAVTIAWEELNFTYTYGQKVWNSQTHEYEVSGSWGNNPTKTVTIKNDSNVAIKFSATYNQETGNDVNGNGTAAVELAFSNAYSTHETIAAATSGTQTATFTVTPTGVPNDVYVTNDVIGNVVVTISATDPNP